MTNLSDYEQRGKEISALYCSTEEELSVMSPPAPQNTYKDRYPDDPINEDPRIADNIIKQKNYEAEVIVYRALEMLKEHLIVLHGFKFTHYQYTLCDRNHDRRNCGKCKSSKNSEECDFLIIGEGFFVVIEVKNPVSDGNPAKAFEGSLIQRNRIEELIRALHPELKVFLYTAFPYFSSGSLVIDDSEQMNSIIFKEDIDNFANWWNVNISTKILLFGRKERQILKQEHEKTKHILLAMSCTEINFPDESMFSLADTVMRIDKELRKGEITLEQNYKQESKKSECKKSINPGVIKATDVIGIGEYLGVTYLTAEQAMILKSKENLLWINGPAGTGKTVLLSGKLIELAKSDPRQTVVVFKFCGPNNNSTTYQDICDKAGVDYELLSVVYKSSVNDTESLSQVPGLIQKSTCSAVIVEINTNRYITRHITRHTSRYTTPLADTLKQLSDCHVLLDDVQCVLDDFEMLTSFFMKDLVGTLKLLSVNNTVIVACDFIQNFWFSIYLNYNDKMSGITGMIKTFNSDQVFTLTKNLRNTCDLSNILCIIRDRSLKHFNQGSVILDNMLPMQDSGHFIRGPLTRLHVFNIRNTKLISNIVNKELIKLCDCRNIVENFKEIAVVYSRMDMDDIVKSVRDAHNTNNITMCRDINSYSAEWPVVVVLCAFSTRHLSSLSKLYLSISRARVMCSVFLFPNSDELKLSQIPDFSKLLEELAPLTHVIRHN